MKTIFGTILALLLIASPSFAESALSEGAPAVLGGTKGADTDECDCKLDPSSINSVQEKAIADAKFQKAWKTFGSGATTPTATPQDVQGADQPKQGH